MGSKRTLILVAAVLVGALAAYALYTYVNGVEDRAYDDAALVEVYVVKGDIPANYDADQAVREKLIDRDKIPQEFRPDNAITDLTVLSGKRSAVALSPNQVVVGGMFADADKVYGTFSERIPTGEVAVTLSVDQVHGVGGWLVPNDEVNLMVVYSPPTEASGSSGGTTELAAADSQAQTVQYLYYKTKILAVGKSAELASGSNATVSGDAGVITFSVTPDAAQRLVLASKTGDVYLSLVPKDYEPSKLPPVDTSNLFETNVLEPSAATANPA